MRKINIDEGWIFQKSPFGSYGAAEDGSAVVDIPHDYMIGEKVTPEAPAKAASGYFTAGAAYYRKAVFIPKEWEGERVYLDFDGVMMNAAVEINGAKVGSHHYGYTPFSLDVTNRVYFGEENTVTVSVNPSMQPNSRWYSGAGIFRSVFLRHVPPIHIVKDGVYGYTKRLTDDGKTAFVEAEAAVRNATAEDHIVLVEVSLIDDSTGGTVLTRKAKIQVDAMSDETAYLSLTVDSPALWDAEHPNLYRLSATVTDLGIFKTHFIETEKKPQDREEVLFGVRTVEADVRNGLQINRKTVKLWGGCAHHDNGLLGAVSLYDAEVRKLKKLKEIGFNAIRTSHNPPSSALIEACDRVGMYVFDEAFDAWGIAKQPGDYNQFFDADWEQDLTAFILRDRSHPSVILWSTGNEIPERGGLNHGYTLAAKLAGKVKSLDGSRLVSNGVCSYWNGLDDALTAENLKKMAEIMNGSTSTLQNADAGKRDTSWEEMSEPFVNGLDVVGYNYMESKYALDHELYPDRVILGSENFPKEIGKHYEMIKTTPYVIGEFTWTAVDYLGEAGIGKALFQDPEHAGDESAALSSHTSPFPWRLANDADLDINGGLRPQGEYRRIVFGADSTRIFAYDPDTYGKKELLSPWGFVGCERTWNFSGKEGKPVRVIVFSRAQEVELLVNGSSLGRKRQGEALGTEDLPFSFVFDTVYQPGEVAAVGYTDGREVSRDSLKTAGKAAGLQIRPDRERMPADGHSLLYVEISVVDENGMTVPEGAFQITAGCRGAAALMGFGSADPITEDDYTDGRTTSYHGRALAILRSGYQPGEAKLCVSAKELGAEEELTVTVE